MGYFDKYHYVIDILKSPVKVSRLYRKHFFTLTYLPSPSSCTTKELVRKYGMKLHEISGLRVGFLFPHEDRFDIHEGVFGPRPTPTKTSAGWRRYFADTPEISANVTSYGSNGRVEEQLGPLAKSSRTIAQDLGILRQVPCILIICHHFSDAVLIKSLVKGTADEILDFFEEFCSAFYDENIQILRAIEQIEEHLDISVYTVEELIDAKKTLEKNAEMLSRLAPSSGIEFVRRAMREDCIHRCLKSGTLLLDASHTDLLSSGRSHQVSTKFNFNAAYQLINDIGSLNDLLSLQPSSGQSSNDLIKRVISNDANLLHLLQDVEIEVSFSFRALIERLNSLTGISRKHLNRLQRYLEKKNQLETDRQIVRIDPDDIGPFFSIVKMLNHVAPPEAENAREIRDKIVSILREVRAHLSVVQHIYLTSLEQELTDLIRKYQRFAKRFATVVSKRLPPPHTTTGYVIRNEKWKDLVSRMILAIQRLSKSVAIPPAVLGQLIRIEDLSKRPSVDEILTLVENDDLLSLTSQGVVAPLSERPDNIDQRHHDVFLAHNSKDKEAVREIAKELKHRQVTVWLDEDQVAPGQKFQDEIQRALSDARSVAIIIGNEEISRWQEMELRSAVSLCLERHKPVIPILLPGVEGMPKELLFLKEFSWVQFHESVRDEGTLNKIIWGIQMAKNK